MLQYIPHPCRKVIFYYGVQPTKPTNSMLRNIAPKMPVYRTKEVIFLFSSNVHSKKEVLFMNRSGMKCVLYPRVSTEMQVDGFSLDGDK